MIGIYKFENLINGQIYIGQSIDIERRYRDHINRSLKQSQTEKNSALHKAIRKYGIDNFSFTIIEECNANELNEKEIFWIKYYNSYNNGYNNTTGGNQQEASKKFDENFILTIKTLLLTTKMTYEEISQKFKISLGRISEINTGKVGYDPQLNYPLRDKKHHYYCKICQKEISSEAKTGMCISCFNKGRREIKRPSREELKRMIRTQTFVDIGKSFSVADNTIKKWCKNYNLPYKKSMINQITDLEWINI